MLRAGGRAGRAEEHDHSANWRNLTCSEQNDLWGTFGCSCARPRPALDGGERANWRKEMVDQRKQVCENFTWWASEEGRRPRRVQAFDPTERLQ